LPLQDGSADASARVRAVVAKLLPSLGEDEARLLVWKQRSR